MEQTMALRYLPTMDMIADSLIEIEIPCMRAVRNPARTYSGIRTYWGQKELQEDILYLLTEQEATFQRIPTPMSPRTNVLAKQII